MALQLHQPHVLTPVQLACVPKPLHVLPVVVVAGVVVVVAGELVLPPTVELPIPHAPSSPATLPHTLLLQ